MLSGWLDYDEIPAAYSSRFGPRLALFASSGLGFDDHLPVREKTEIRRAGLILREGRCRQTHLISPDTFSPLQPKMPIETLLTKKLGIRVPVVQGGMMYVGEKGLVAAVSNAGGLGILTGLTPGSPEKLREAIREVRKLTSKPLYVPSCILPDQLVVARLCKLRSFED